MLRDYYILRENDVVYPIDHDLIKRCNEVVLRPEFSRLRGADLIFSCIVFLEDAYLVTLDNKLDDVALTIRVINLNDSRDEPKYRRKFGI